MQQGFQQNVCDCAIAHFTPVVSWEQLIMYPGPCNIFFWRVKILYSSAFCKWHDKSRVCRIDDGIQDYTFMIYVLYQPFPTMSAFSSQNFVFINKQFLHSEIFGVMVCH